jgi:hypothetical protein
MRARFFLPWGQGGHATWIGVRVTPMARFPQQGRSFSVVGLSYEIPYTFCLHSKAGSLT